MLLCSLFLLIRQHSAPSNSVPSPPDPSHLSVSVLSSSIRSDSVRSVLSTLRAPSTLSYLFSVFPRVPRPYFLCSLSSFTVPLPLRICPLRPSFPFFPLPLVPIPTSPLFSTSFSCNSQFHLSSTSSLPPFRLFLSSSPSNNLRLQYFCITFSLSCASNHNQFASSNHRN